MRPRIAVAGFQHETNTFAPIATRYEDFEQGGAWPGLTRGEAVREVFHGMNIPISGFIAEAGDWEREPILWASAEPCQLDRILYRRLRPGVRLGPHGPAFDPQWPAR